MVRELDRALNHVHGNPWHYHPWPSRHDRTPLRREVTSYRNISLRKIVLKWTWTGKDPVSELEISDPLNALGRLAVHTDWTSQGIGRGLLKDAVLRTAGVAKEIGVRALLCHTISANAKAFYLKYGFAESPLHPMTLLMPIT